MVVLFTSALSRWWVTRRFWILVVCSCVGRENINNTNAAAVRQNARRIRAQVIAGARKTDGREREMRHKGQNPHIPDNLNLRKRRIVRGTSSAHSQRGPTAGLQSRETVDRNKERVETPLQPRDFARKNQWSQQFPASLVPPDAQERKPVQGIAPISARTPPPPH